jgi:hypothetical protein
MAMAAHCDMDGVLLQLHKQGFTELACNVTGLKANKVRPATAAWVMVVTSASRRCKRCCTVLSIQASCTRSFTQSHMASSTLQSECIPDVLQHQQRYIRLPGSVTATFSGELRYDAALAQDHVVPMRVSLDLVQAPSCFCLPVLQKRSLDPPFHVSVPPDTRRIRRTLAVEHPPCCALLRACPTQLARCKQAMHASSHAGRSMPRTLPWLHQMEPYPQSHSPRHHASIAHA